MKQLVWKIRWFWDDADHAIERWLGQMAREGWHLQRVSCLRTVFIFRRGQPADVTYRIDFRLTRTDQHYLQLFQDAGWERVDEALGWQFWRAPSHSVRVAEIFTDAESMARKYRQLIWLFAVPLAVALPVTVLRFPEQLANAPGKLAFGMATVALGIYCIGRLVRRLRSLHQP
ncbi:MAG: hypothetical protein K0R43_893 [Pseudoduganella sp.]|jgi:hypothetical protein|nr:hypothetical protein [Pseudoduganella sp.]